MQKNSTKSDIVYGYGDALYLNICSRCPTACEFCIKQTWGYRYRGHNLLLTTEPTVEEIVEAAGDPSKYSELVFCGYGESTYRLEEMKGSALQLKAKGARRIRLNTVGLGNLIHGRDIVPDLAGFLDSVHISLNVTTPEEWAKVHRPLPEFKEKGFESVLGFIRECVKMIPETLVTAVDLPGHDPKKFEAFVRGLGAKTRSRPFLDDYEEK